MIFIVCLVIKFCVYKGDRRRGKGREGKMFVMVNLSDLEFYFFF